MKAYEWTCPSCGGEVYPGEPLFYYKGNYICAECLRDDVRFMTVEQMARFGGLTSKIYSKEQGRQESELQRDCD